jgi:hypothetical protein
MAGKPGPTNVGVFGTFHVCREATRFEGPVMGLMAFGTHTINVIHPPYPRLPITNYFSYCILTVLLSLPLLQSV